MAGNVILLDKLFKNREIKITGNILSACICIGKERDTELKHALPASTIYRS